MHIFLYPALAYFITSHSLREWAHVASCKDATMPVCRFPTLIYFINIPSATQMGPCHVPKERDNYQSSSQSEPLPQSESLSQS